MNSPKLSNGQTLAQLAEQGIYVAPVRNPKTGSLFLVDVDTRETIGSIGKSLIDEVSAMLTQAERTQKPVSMPSDWVVSDMETEENGEVNTMKCLHKRGEVSTLLVTSRPALTKVATKSKY